MGKLPFEPLDSFQDEPDDAPETQEEALQVVDGPVLFLLVGLPAAGKTSAACELSRRWRMPIVSVESLREGITGPLVQVANDDFPEHLQWMTRNALGWYLTRGMSVLLDAGNLTRQARSGYLELVRKLGGYAVVILVVCSPKILKERQNAKGINPAHGKLLASVFETPELSEGILQVQIYETDPPEADPVEVLETERRAASRLRRRSRDEYEAA